MNQYELELYIAGRTPASRRAVANLRKLCQREWPETCRLAVIDILDRPAVAEEKKILATPTLIRAYPPPARRIIGDMSDLEKVVFYLDMPPVGAMTDPREGDEE
jgi:circadian clock protein KaiB